MKSPKVRIYIRIRRDDGTYAFVDPAWNRNRTLRGGYSHEKGGVPEQHPEGTYYLRYKRDGKRRQWIAVGNDPERAIVSLRNIEHDLQAILLGREAWNLPDAPAEVSTDTELSLDGAIQNYLNDVRNRKSAKTIAAAENMLERFKVNMTGKLLSDITRADLLNYGVALERSGLSRRTVHNHLSRIRAFMKASEVAWPLKTGDMPDYDEDEAKAYDSDQLARLFANADPEERLLFEFFLYTGFREQEVMHCTWVDVDFKSKVIFVKAKPRFGFRVKNKKGRSVPVPDSLMDALTERRKHSASILLFPGRSGAPDGHMLRKLQTLAYRANLNCGECVTKGGVSCSERAVCSAWGLHQFRRTMATMHHEAGVSPRSIQHWLGHADLATTLPFLRKLNVRFFLSEFLCT